MEPADFAAISSTLRVGVPQEKPPENIPEELQVLEGFLSCGKHSVVRKLSAIEELHMQFSSIGGRMQEPEGILLDAGEYSKLPKVTDTFVTKLLRRKVPLKVVHFREINYNTCTVLANVDGKDVTLNGDALMTTPQAVLSFAYTSVRACQYLQTISGSPEFKIHKTKDATHSTLETVFKDSVGFKRLSFHPIGISVDFEIFCNINIVGEPTAKYRKMFSDTRCSIVDYLEVVKLEQ